MLVKDGCEAECVNFFWVLQIQVDSIWNEVLCNRGVATMNSEQKRRVTLDVLDIGVCILLHDFANQICRALGTREVQRSLLLIISRVDVNILFYEVRSDFQMRASHRSQ